MVNEQTMKVAIAQCAPVFLDREATLAKVVAFVKEAGRAGCALVCFPEALVPGYPVWLERTEGARFNDPDQKRLFARYLDQGVVPEAGDLREVQAAAREFELSVVLGVMERAQDRGSHSLYCSAVFIGADGALKSVHRKLMPTYEERLVWAAGDGAGLVVHPVGPFTVGALNCWENWMPFARMALHGQGENLHVALWPGSERNTRDSTPFAAMESRSYVIAASGLLRDADIPLDIPLREQMVRRPGEVILHGGSGVASPDGSWLVEPVLGEERLIFAELDPAKVREERQNFDPSGHYSRPDVFSLQVSRVRQASVTFNEE